MTNQEKYDLMTEVEDRIRDALQHEHDILKRQEAHVREQGRTADADRLKDMAYDMILAKIVVTGATIPMFGNLIKNVSPDDNIVIKKKS